MADFPPRKGTKDGLSYLCRSCTREIANASARRRWAEDPALRERRMRQHREWYDRMNADGQMARKERLRGYARYHKHGMTVEDYDRMAEAQGGVCAICGGLPTRTKYLHVDHEHATGVRRGLLCDPCNLGLGKFKDDPALLDQAAAYLRAHRAGRDPAVNE